MVSQSIIRRGHKSNVLITRLIRLILPHRLGICAVPLPDVQADAVREADQVGELQEGGIGEND